MHTQISKSVSCPTRPLAASGSDNRDAPANSNSTRVGPLEKAPNQAKTRHSGTRFSMKRLEFDCAKPTANRSDADPAVGDSSSHERLEFGSACEEQPIGAAGRR